MEELDIKWATTSVCHRPEGKFIKAFMCIGPLYASHLDLRTALWHGKSFHFIDFRSLVRLRTQG